MASEHVTTLSDENFADTISAEGEPVLVDFWAEWCGPCKMIAPILDEIADEQVGSVKIAKLNVDDAPDTARQHEVMSIPTMILFKDGQPVKRIVGAKPKDALMAEISEYI
ncbi:MAG: thioredoxin [Acidimicrobiales bacterium]|nr:thioredoxin [Acidimicrobiales bacterium]RZV47581.1 MAG: thioredoxin [Acidimicrobiales bacterium]